MRNFLYLDTDFLTSFVAQIEKGITDETHLEELRFDQQEQSEPEIVISPKLEADIKILMAKLRAEVETSVKINPLKETSAKTLRSIEIKKRNDEIFDIFERYIQEKKICRKKSTINIGNYLDDTYTLNFINFTRIEALFEESLRDAYTCYSEADHFSFENFNSIRKNLTTLKTTIPHDTFLCGENIFIPIIDDYLRANKEQIGFSFEQTVKVVGRVKKRVGFSSSSQPNITKTLNEIQHMSFKILQKLGFLKSTSSTKLYIIYPIAIYL